MSTGVQEIEANIYEAIKTPIGTNDVIVRTCKCGRTIALASLANACEFCGYDPVQPLFVKIKIREVD